MIRFMKSQIADTTLNVRRFRERLRERGLVKKDVWILPEYAAQLTSIEKSMREPSWAAPSSDQTPAEAQESTWTLDTLERALSLTPIAQSGFLRVERIEGAEDSLRLIRPAAGEPDVAILLAVSGEQILVEAYLWPSTSISDTVAFNECILHTHKYLPLSTFSLTDVAGVPGYTLFGSLSSHCPLSSILFEIQMLSENVSVARILYAQFLQQEGQAS